MSAENNNGKKDHWFQDWLVYGQWWILAPFLIIIFLIASPNYLRNKKATQEFIKRQVIIYAAQDQVYAEPILRDFEKATRIKVRAVYDSEAVKTVGLANRLLAERSHPQCDVFWGNEEMRTRQLAAQGVFRETNGWAAFGYRSRRLVINTNLVEPALAGNPSPGLRPPSPRPTGRGKGEGQRKLPSAPCSLLELTNAVWRGKIALAYPLFGTTATHFLALRQHWGEAGWLAWCRALQANQPFVVDGNSVVVKLVGRGEAWIGLTDSDDIAAGQADGLPVAGVPMREVLFIPNTVAVVRHPPHPESAQRLFEYLQSRAVSDRLVAANALEHVGPSLKDGLVPNWDELLSRLERDTTTLKGVFLR